MKEKMEQRLRILKELKEERRKELERLENAKSSDLMVCYLMKELNYYEREILRLSKALTEKNIKLNESAEMLIDNIKNIVNTLNNAEWSVRTEELKTELINLMNYTNEHIDMEIWTPLENEDREE